MCENSWGCADVRRCAYKSVQTLNISDCICSCLGRVIAIAGAQDGVTPVATAVDQGNQDIVRMLIEAKADPNVSHNVRMLA